MSIEACAELVRLRDPQRHASVTTAPGEAQPGLFALYAFNAEIFHAIWSSHVPEAAEIRLQYWSDQVSALYAGRATDAHPVLEALGTQMHLFAGAREDMLGLIEARRWEAYSEPFADAAAMWAFLDATGGGLMQMAAQACGLDPNLAAKIRAYGTGAALAAFLQAVAALKARGRRPLVDETDAALRKLAGDGLDRMQGARGQPALRRARPVFLSATEARPMLHMVLREPGLVLRGGLIRSPLRQRLRAASVAAFGLW